MQYYNARTLYFQPRYVGTLGDRVRFQDLPTDLQVPTLAVVDLIWAATGFPFCGRISERLPSLCTAGDMTPCRATLYLVIWSSKVINLLGRAGL